MKETEQNVSSHSWSWKMIGKRKTRFQPECRKQVWDVWSDSVTGQKSWFPQLLAIEHWRNYFYSFNRCFPKAFLYSFTVLSNRLPEERERDKIWYHLNLKCLPCAYALHVVCWLCKVLESIAGEGFFQKEKHVEQVFWYILSLSTSWFLSASMLVRMWTTL